MPQRSHNTPVASGPITVVQMAERLSLSVRRFYELINAGKFPPPVYRLDNRKPFYTPELQEACIRVRETGEAFDGSMLLFNRRRTPRSASGGCRLRPVRRTSVVQTGGDEHADLIAYLDEHGVVATASQVREALATCFPNGTAGVEQGRVWREAFRHLRAQNRT